MCKAVFAFLFETDALTNLAPSAPLVLNGLHLGCNLHWCTKHVMHKMIQCVFERASNKHIWLQVQCDILRNRYRET